MASSSRVGQAHAASLKPWSQINKDKFVKELVEYATVNKDLKAGTIINDFFQSKTGKNISGPKAGEIKSEMRAAFDLMFPKGLKTTFYEEAIKWMSKTSAETGKRKPVAPGSAPAPAPKSKKPRNAVKIVSGASGEIDLAGEDDEEDEGTGAGDADGEDLLGDALDPYLKNLKTNPFKNADGGFIIESTAQYEKEPESLEDAEANLKTCEGILAAWERAEETVITELNGAITNIKEGAKELIEAAQDSIDMIKAHIKKFKEQKKKAKVKPAAAAPSQESMTPGMENMTLEQVLNALPPDIYKYLEANKIIDEEGEIIKPATMADHKFLDEYEWKDFSLKRRCFKCGLFAKASATPAAK
jgi:hypothetical protein